MRADDTETPPAGEKFANYCGDTVYVKTSAKYANDEGLESKRREILKELDLVISADTSINHLAGILGVNSILLLNYNNDWRWFDADGNVITDVIDYVAYVKILSALTVTEDRFTRLVKVEMLHPTPQKAKEWLEWIIEDLNEYFREADRKEAEEAIAYLQEKMGKNNLSNLDKMFANSVSASKPWIAFKS